MASGSLTQCASNPVCDRRPRYFIDTGEPGGVGQSYVCRGHLEDHLFTLETPFSGATTVRVSRLAS